MMRSRLPLAALALALALPATAQDASEQEADAAPSSDLTVGLQGGTFGVGFASTWPAYGVSGTYQLSETITAEAILGFLGTVTSYGARGWYRFKPGLDYDLYAYGAVGTYRYDYVFDTESVVGFGGGAGIEGSLQKLLDDEELPPIFLNAEVGLAIANFEYYNFSSFVFGAGIHYRFGGD